MVRHSPSPERSSSGRAAEARCPCSLGAVSAGVGACHRPHSVRSCELALHAGGWQKGVQGGAPLASMRGASVQAPVLP